jgi:succinate-semialdehyde dehydrogenase
MVGIEAPKAAKLMGFDIPSDTKVILIDATDMAKDDSLRRELLCTILKIFPRTSLRNRLRTHATIFYGRRGHTAVIYTNDYKISSGGSKALPVCRMVVNQSSLRRRRKCLQQWATIRYIDLLRHLGQYSISDNLTYKHMLNITRVSSIIPDAHTPTPEEVWGE